MHRNRLIFAAAVIAASAPVPRGAVAQRADAGALVRQAQAAIGGEAIARARAVTTTGVMHEYMIGNAERPEGPWRVSYSRFTELRPAGGTRLRRTEVSLGAAGNSPERITLLTDSVVTLRQGTNEMPALPMFRDDLSAYVAMHPDRALQLAAASAALRLERPVLRHGVVHDVVSFPWEGRRMSIEISRDSHLPVAVELHGEFAHDFRRAPFGDVRLRADYDNWTAEAGEVWWPHQYRFTLDGELLRDMTIATVALEAAELPADLFVVSDSLRALYRDNARNSPPNFAFGSRGEPEELREGIIRMRDFWTMTAVRQDDGIILFEAHLTGPYLNQVIDYLAAKYPALPVKAIVMTSDPWAHVGGVREAVARGIPIYVNERSIPFLTRVVKSSHASNPDRLQRAPRVPRFIPVNRKTVIGTGTNRIELHPVGGAYAERMVMAYFPGHKLLYGSDLVFADRQQQGYFRTPAIELRRAVAREGLSVDSLFSVQARPVIAWTEFVPAPR